MKRKRWSQVDCDLLLAMKAEGKPTFRIAQHFGVTEHAVNMKALKLREAKLHPKKPKPERPAAPQSERAPKQPWQRNGERWTEEENAQLLDRGDKGETFTSIGEAINRTRWASKVQYHSLKRGTAADPPSVRTTREAKAQVATQAREARTFHQSLTSAFFGDPLPGRSALDQKRAQQT